MRRVIRQSLQPQIDQFLRDKQSEVARKYFSIDDEKTRKSKIKNFWNNTRQKKEEMNDVFRTLRNMAGPRGRCMYCVDSEGGDIEHFRPKTKYPEHIFQWSNLLLCCTNCGRIKGEKFAFDSNHQPLIIDPSVEDPWQFLDFDTITGNIVARFDLSTGDEIPKGSKTVEILQLDRREAIAKGYLRTFQRITVALNNALQQPVLDAPILIHDLIEADDHGLLGWCFHGTGALIPPFADLYTQHPDVWEACRAALL